MRVFPSSLLFACLLHGCVGDDPALSSAPDGKDAGGEPPVNGNPNQGTLTIQAPPDVQLTAGKSAKISVKVTRGAGLSGDVRLELTGAPEGLTATSGVIGGDSSSGDLEITAGASARHGRFEAKVVARAGSPEVVADAKIDIVVRGAAGAIDTSFGNGGKVVTDFGGSERVEAAALAPDGKIVVVGLANDQSIAVARYTIEGELDPMFGSGGKTTVTFAAAGKSVPFDVAVRPDGKIVIAGELRTSSHTSSDVGLLRLLDNGALDTGFGSGGRTTLDFDVFDSARALALLPDGKIVIAAATSTDGGIGSSARLALVRFRDTGAIDDSGNFGTGYTGIFKNNNPDKATVPTALAIRPDKAGFYVGGWTSTDAAAAPFSFALFSFGPAGLSDASFPAGPAQTMIGTSSRPWALCVQPDGRAILAGEAIVSGTPRLGVARYTTSGTPDASFGGDPAPGTTAPPFPGFEVRAWACALQADGKILAGGEASSNPKKFTLARFQSDGGLDFSFGEKAVVYTSFGTKEDQNAILKSILVQPDGRIVLAGYVLQAAGNFDFAIARYWP